MNLRDQIQQLEFQLTLKHTQPNTVPRLSLAHSLLIATQTLWRMPGMQVHAIRLEDHANVILRALDRPLE